MTKRTEILGSPPPDTPTPYWLSPTNLRDRRRRAQKKKTTLAAHCRKEQEAPSPKQPSSFLFLGNWHLGSHAPTALCQLATLFFCVWRIRHSCPPSGSQLADFPALPLRAGPVPKGVQPQSFSGVRPLPKSFSPRKKSCSPSSAHFHWPFPFPPFFFPFPFLPHAPQNPIVFHRDIFILF